MACVCALPSHVGLLVLKFDPKLLTTAAAASLLSYHLPSCDSHVLYSAQRMAAAVGDQGDDATAAQLSEWLLQRPAVVRALHARLQRPAHEVS